MRKHGGFLTFPFSLSSGSAQIKAQNPIDFTPHCNDIFLVKGGRDSMTIKDFAQLCACKTQTLRYYDRIGLLKPARVDPWSGYRHYEPAQAMDFIKIKNLQAADFTIDEIRKLLIQSDRQVYEAFTSKIAQQEQKLERIRKIQCSYLTEKNTMEQIIYSMTDYLLSHCGHPEVLAEFGLSPADAPQILARLKRYMNSHICADMPKEDVTMTINDEVIHGQETVLKRIHSLTKENLSDTILLSDGPGHKTETEAEGDPDFQDWDIVWEHSGWDHVSDFMDAIPQLQQGKQYCLWLRKTDPAYTDDLSFSLFLVGAILHRQQLETVPVNCSVTICPEGENHFTLLSKQALPAQP